MFLFLFSGDSPKMQEIRKQHVEERKERNRRRKRQLEEGKTLAARGFTKEEIE